ncbi:hypothetical protein [Brachyspira pulli]|uniref:hypothetical protein n=1 Tax=Brachyspira pulli TaxID=310721 RepID=UPI0030078744
MPLPTVGVYTVRDNTGYGDITVDHQGIQLRIYDYNGNTIVNTYFSVSQISRSREKRDAGKMVNVYSIGYGAEEITFIFSDLRYNKYQIAELRSFSTGDAPAIFTRQ